MSLMKICKMEIRGKKIKAFNLLNFESKDENPYYDSCLFYDKRTSKAYGEWKFLSNETALTEFQLFIWRQKINRETAKRRTKNERD